MKRGTFWKSISCFLVIVAMVWGSAALAAELHVPSLLYPTIQDAINAAAPGDEVMVADGVYGGKGNVNLLVEKAITIRSANGAEKTTIGCEGQSRAFTFGADASGAVLSGFTIIGGNGQGEDYEGWGGAILILDGGFVTISDCGFFDNVAEAFGGAIASVNSSPLISHCVIENNSAEWGGGGLFIWGDSADDDVPPPLILSSRIANNPGDENPDIARGGGAYLVQSTATFYNCLIAGNSATTNGGAFFFDCDSSPNIIHCTISGNSVSGTGNNCGGGGISAWFSSPVMINSIVWGNSAEAGAEIHLSSNKSFDISYSNVRGYLDANTFVPQNGLSWGEGNIDLDPLFMGPGDYRLSADSPCIDAGDELIVDWELWDLDDYAYDIEGDLRDKYPDMGADEFVEGEQIIQVKIDVKPGCPHNKIYLKSWGLLAVAVKTTQSFDAGSVDPYTVQFARARPVWRIYYDVDRDGFKDMVFFFRIRALHLKKERTEATLTGQTKYGDFIEGTDKVTIIKPYYKAWNWRWYFAKR